jgi:hypothetical protein
MPLAALDELFRQESEDGQWFPHRLLVSCGRAAFTVGWPLTWSLLEGAEREQIKAAPSDLHRRVFR